MSAGTSLILRKKVRVVSEILFRRLFKKKRLKEKEYRTLLDRMYRAEMYIRLLQKRVTRLEEGEEDA